MKDGKKKEKSTPRFSNLRIKTIIHSANDKNEPIG